jgi:hypothetical protein
LLFRISAVAVLGLGGLVGAVIGFGEYLTTPDGARVPVAAAPTARHPHVMAHAKQQAQQAAEEAATQAKRAAVLAARTQQAASRSQPRTSYPVPASCNEYTGNRALGCALLLDAGYELDQMPCLDRLWTKESGWNHRSVNRSSGAYGIPQALPGEKMAAYGADWQTNPVTQIKWGLNYIKNRYQTPCSAWAFFQTHNWY